MPRRTEQEQAVIDVLRVGGKAPRLIRARRRAVVDGLLSGSGGGDRVQGGEAVPKGQRIVETLEGDPITQALLEVRGWYEELLSCLYPRQVELVRLRFEEGLTFDMTVARMDCARATAIETWHRALVRLVGIAFPVGQNRLF